MLCYMLFLSRLGCLIFHQEESPVATSSRSGRPRCAWSIHNRESHPEDCLHRSEGDRWLAVTPKEHRWVFITVRFLVGRNLGKREAGILLKLPHVSLSTGYFAGNLVDWSRSRSTRSSIDDDSSPSAGPLRTERELVPLLCNIYTCVNALVVPRLLLSGCCRLHDDHSLMFSLYRVAGVHTC